MAPDMWRWWGYDYQWILSYYLYMLMKEEKYSPNKTNKNKWWDFNIFIDRIDKFKNKCFKKYGTDFHFKLDILVEWEDNCLDDISFISNSSSLGIDNVVFIQVKTKWWDKSEIITTPEAVYKAIKNFLININFQKDKIKDNLSFFIFCNKNFSDSLTNVFQSKWPELYLRFINYLCKWTILDIYPSEGLKKLYKKENRSLVTDVLKWENIYNKKYLKIYSKEYLEKLLTLIYDLKIIFTNLDILEKIEYDTLESELMWFYEEIDFLRNERRIRQLCWKWDEIRKGTPEFERYEKYKNTYFHPKDWWKLIHEIDVITKWKFI